MLWVDLTARVLRAPGLVYKSACLGFALLSLSGCEFDKIKPAITVSAPPQLITSEDNQTTASFSVVLDAKPDDMVSISLRSSNLSEATVDTEQISFNSTNWSTPVTVSVSGIDDALADGDTTYSIVFGPSRSGDKRYNNLSVRSLSGVNRDNEGTPPDKPAASISVTPTSVNISETGTTAKIQVNLSRAPENDVTVAAVSMDTTEATIEPASLTFTPINWETPQEFTVAGVDDDVIDGNQTSAVTFSTQSADPDFNGITIAQVNALNEDDDAPPPAAADLRVSPTNGLVTSEATSATFNVALTALPTADVTVTLTSGDTTEGTVSDNTLLFTSENWSVMQTVTVTGVNDFIIDGDVTYDISFSVQSADPAYNGINAAPLQVTNQDNDRAGLVFTGPVVLTTSEAAGTSLSFTAALTSQPAAQVTLAISSSDPGEAIVSRASLIFTPADWSTPQDFNVTGVNEFIDDGDANFTITFAVQSSDGDYNGISVASLAGINQDDDTAGVALTGASGLMTSESGTTASFTAVLTSEPTAAVTISLLSSNTGEGTVSPASLTFNTTNWNQPQSVSITGVDDGAVDGNINYSISLAVSGDAAYNTVTVGPIAAINLDNDSAPLPGVTVFPRTLLQTSENPQNASFTVVLNSPPSAGVTVSVASSDISEGTVSPASLNFTTATWNMPQTVTVIGQNDNVADGNVDYNISFSVQSTDNNYNGMLVDQISVVNLDNDTPNILVTPPANLTTSENLTEATFTVVLTSEPTGDVTITVSSSDLTEATVSPGSLIFSAANWNTPRTVAVRGVDDAQVDGTVSYSITFTVQSPDANYNNRSVASITAVNQDNDVAPPAAVNITPTVTLQTSENLTTATLNVVLNSQPTANVTVTVISGDLTEGTVSPGNVIFTTANWNTPQTVTISGQNDNVADGTITYNITFSVQSTDSRYNNLTVAPRTVQNLDNDTAGYVFTSETGLTTSEAGATDSFTLALRSEPTADVVISVISSNTSEGAVSPGGLTFTSANWNTARTVTLTGADDAAVDGNVTYSISFTVQSTDSVYSGMGLSSLTAVNLDNDTAPPPSSYRLYIEPGIISISASTITNNGSAQLPAVGYALSNALPGETPGPVIEAVVGQATTIEVVNDHLHPHGFEILGLLAGGTLLQPGETGLYQFTPTRAGVYRYGDPQLNRRALGLQGAVVVRPAGSPNTAWDGGPAFDHERTWVVSDFDESWLRNPSGINVNLYNPNYFLVNGKSGFAAMEDPAIVIDGNWQETFLIRIVNAGQFDQSLHFHSSHFQIISEGGFNYTNLAVAPFATTVNVKRDSTAMVLFTLDKVGTFPVHAHTAQMETSNGVYLNGTVTHIIGR